MTGTHKSVSVYDFTQAARDAMQQTIQKETGKTTAVDVHAYSNTAAVSWADRGSHIDATLYLPAMPIDAKLTRHAADLFTGYWAHETGHVLYTDMSVWNEASGHGKAFVHLLNALEDARIERALIRNGAIANGHDLFGALVSHIHDETAAQVSMSDPSAFTWIAAVLSREALSGYATHAANDIRATAPQHVLDLLDSEMPALDRAQNTRNVFEIVKRLHKAMQPPKQGQDGQDGSQSAQDGSQSVQDGQDGSQSAQDGQDGQDGSQSAQDGSQSAQDDSQSAQDGQDGSQSAQDQYNADALANSQSTEPDMNKLAEEITKHHGEGEPDYRETYLRSIETNMTSPRKQAAWRQRISDPENMYQRIRELLKNSARLRRDTRLLVKAVDKLRRTHRETRGRLDRHSLSRARAGRADIFTTREDTPGETAAVTLLLDGSGSMSGNRAFAATCLAIHLIEACKRANAPVSVLAFKDSQHGSKSTLVPLKPFGKYTEKHKHMVAAMPYNTGGGTPLSPSIIAAANELRQQQADRHILIALTDGQCSYREDCVRKAVRLATDKGVETVFIGLDMDVSMFGVPHVTVGNMKQVASEGLGLLTRTLTRKAA